MCNPVPTTTAFRPGIRRFRLAHDSLTRTAGAHRVMDNNSLEEQVVRIRQLSEWMSQVQNRTVELSDEIEKTRQAMWQGPLYEVRDFRLVSHPSLTRRRRR